MKNLLISAISLLFTCALVGCAATTGDDDDSGSPGEVIEDPTWDDVQPILSSVCTPCHTAPGAGSGGILWLDSYDAVSADAGNDTACTDTRANCIPGRIERQEMPDGAPAGCTIGEEGCFTQIEFDIIQNWVDDGAPE